MLNKSVMSRPTISAGPWMPSSSSARRVAASTRPVTLSAIAPSLRVPTNSGRLWKRTMYSLRNWCRNTRFSIICTDALTSASVCCCASRDSPEASSTAISSPLWLKIGAAAQLSPILRDR